MTDLTALASATADDILARVLDVMVAVKTGDQSAAMASLNLISEKAIDLKVAAKPATVEVLTRVDVEPTHYTYYELIDEECSKADLTQKEEYIYRHLLELAIHEAYLELSDIVDVIDWDMKSIRGVVGSLVKKGYVSSSPENINGKVIDALHPILAGELVGFACDHYNF